MSQELTKEQKSVISPFISNVEGDVFVLKNLPEVIKGALFSRYSRSPKSLKLLLLDEFIEGDGGDFSNIVGTSDAQDQTLRIQKAQKFYDRILDGYGDDSIGELGGAHVGLENISNIATKLIEDARIGGSPLEKSTRYIFFDKKANGDYLFYKVPKIMKSPLKDLYLSHNRSLFELYVKLIEPMKEYFRKKNPREDDTPESAYNFSIRARACDALRGILPASTLTNMGVFGNGRFFEYLLFKLRSSGLEEMHAIADKLQAELDKVIPSFVRRCKPDHRHFEPMKEFIQTRELAAKNAAESFKLKPSGVGPKVTLVDYDKWALDKVISTVVFNKTHSSLEEIKAKVASLSPLEKKKILDEYFSARKTRRDKPGRAFENAVYTFEILADFGSYRDLQRHRILTQERQNLSVHHGFELPPEIVDAGLEKEYSQAMEESKEVYEQIYEKFPEEAQYVVPFAFHIRWYFTINLRSIYWLCELRSTPQGHPTYRRVAQQMYEQVKAVHPQLAEGMRFVDMDDYGLGRLQAEIRKEKKRSGK